MIRRTLLASALPIAAVPAIGSASLAAPPAGPPTADDIHAAVAAFLDAQRQHQEHETNWPDPDRPRMIHRRHEAVAVELDRAERRARRKLAVLVRRACHGSMPAAVSTADGLIVAPWTDSGAADRPGETTGFLPDRGFGNPGKPGSITTGLLPGWVPEYRVFPQFFETV
jgi:hypothetical protein